MSDKIHSTTKQCTRCHETKIIQEFHRMAKSPDGYRTICKKCRAIAEGKEYIPYEPPGFKYCRHCQQMLPATNEYYQAVPNGKYGLESRCRDCKNAEWAERYHKDIEVSRASARARYAINPEPHRERSRKRSIENPQYAHDWYLANKERLQPIRRLYYDNNYDYLRLKNIEWEKKNPDKVKAKQEKYRATEKGIVKGRRSASNYRKSHPEITRIRAKISKHKRRAKMLLAESSLKSNEVLDLYREMEGRCGYCGIPVSLLVEGDVHLDHMNPLSRGGSDTIDNVIISCADCNLAKHDKTVIEWEAMRGW